MINKVDGRTVEVMQLGTRTAIWNQWQVPGGTEIVAMVVTASRDCRGIGMSIHKRIISEDCQEVGETFVVMGEDEAFQFIDLMQAALAEARRMRETHEASQSPAGPEASGA